MEDDIATNPDTQIKRLKKALQGWLGKPADGRSLASNLVLFPDVGPEQILQIAQKLAGIMEDQRSYKKDAADRPTIVTFLDAAEAIRRTGNTPDMYELMQDCLRERPQTDVLVVTGLEATFDRSIWDRRQHFQDRQCAEEADVLRTFKGLQYGRDEGNFGKTPVFSVLCLPEWLYVPVRIGFADFVSWSFTYDLSRWEVPVPGGSPAPAAQPFPAGP